MVTVLVTAEVLAVPYYRAVHRISSCPTLRAICRRILREEAQHLLFQASTLATLQRTRPAWWTALTRSAQHILLAGTCLIVWAHHGPVLRRGRINLLTFVLSCRALLRHVHRAVRSAEATRRVGEKLSQVSPRTLSNAQHRTGSLADNGVQK
jgi:hypothetical protein